MRRHWIDNLRWVTVLLVLLYHVLYFYNNKGVVGGMGGFGDGPQYQDVVMYILYPWFMPLLFILAGISAKYALDRRSPREWFKMRTRKLLVPSTIGLFFIGAAIGRINTMISPAVDTIESLPIGIKYLIWALYHLLVQLSSSPKSRRFSCRMLISSKPQVRKTMSSPHQLRKASMASGKGTPSSRS